ncbi:MAG: DNA/RNA non-specific endonuclease, partial [Clostridia bacterium]|nr:DNA/RNA non-specific endonuclease [Clostridia bacterium]
MKYTKKLLALLLSALMLLSFAGCDLSLPEDNSSSGIDNSYIVVNTTETASEQAVSSDVTSSKAESSAVSQKKEVKSYVGTGVATAVNASTLPSFSGNAYTVVNNNQPNFSAGELTTTGYEKYSVLDNLGRCGVAVASCGKETMPAPNEKRGSISSIYPTGWRQKSYSGISGGYLWNRCHLIGWQLSAENANKQNLITGTRYMNVNGMLPFENMVADYIKETNNHVAYRITPVFEGDNLVCSGVQMEAYSIEDKGNGICFNVYCYNVQPGI